MLAAIFCAAVLTASAADRNGVSATLQPSETGVLLLPALDITKEAANMQAPRQVVVRHRQQVELLARQFKVMGEAMALKVAKTSPDIDLYLLSARTPENLDLLATRVGADWVVHTVIEEVDANTDASGTFVIKTRLLIQVRDARRKDWLLNQRYTGQATGGGSPVMIFLRSLDNAAQGALATVLDAYPRRATVEAEDSLVDYLAGQTEPVVAETGKSFPAPRAM